MRFEVELPRIPDAEYNIKDFGAVSGGLVSNTRAINEAVAKANENGGGRVIVPAGIWLTGPVELKSNIDFHVETGAVLLFSKEKEEYPLYMSDYEGMEVIRAASPIHAEHASNIAITGNGVIDGNGQLWRPVKQFKVTAGQWNALLEKSPYTITAKDSEIWLPTQTSLKGFQLSMNDPKALEDIRTAKECWDYYRPVLVRLYHCDHILIENVTLQNSPAWNVHPCFCEHITIRNASIRNPYEAQNGDGLDLESCRYAHIHDTTFDVGDDAICMKAGKGAKARQIPVPTEDVSIHDCTVYHGHGGFVVGSEMSRGVRNVEVSNCSFIGTDVGIRFKSALGRGGVVENITLENIQMTDIAKEAIIFTMGYVLDYREKKQSAEKVNPDDIPYFKNITLRHITCSSAETGLMIEGIDMEQLAVEDKTSVINGITLEDSHIAAKVETRLEHAGEVTLNRVEWV